MHYKNTIAIYPDLQEKLNGVFIGMFSILVTSCLLTDQQTSHEDL